MYWPQEIWELYGDKLEDFKDPANEKAAVQCLNHMLSDCLQHFAPGIKALSLVRSQKMFNILVIPAITAFVHISRLYNNPNVFRGTCLHRLLHLKVQSTSFPCPGPPKVGALKAC